MNRRGFFGAIFALPFVRPEQERVDLTFVGDGFSYDQIRSQIIPRIEEAAAQVVNNYKAAMR